MPDIRFKGMVKTTMKTENTFNYQEKDGVSRSF